MDLFKIIAVFCLFVTQILAKPYEMGCNICGYEGAVKRYTHDGRRGPIRASFRHWTDFPHGGPKVVHPPEVVSRLKLFREYNGSPWDKKWG